MFLLVGLPGTGKTTEALRLAEQTPAIRFSPDEWMQPLFAASDPGGLRDVLEGRLIWVALQALRAGASVVLDFGFWGRDERTALRWLAATHGGRSTVVFCDLEESERRRRIARRFAADPGNTFAMTDEEIDAHRAIFQPPDDTELAEGPLDPVPPSHPSWADWAADRWPSSRLPAVP